MAKPKRFKRKPAAKAPALPDEEKVARFVSGARKRQTAAARPWEAFDPAEKSTVGMNLRLNEYQITLLRFLAEADDRSVQQTIKRLLIPAAEAAADKL